MATERDVKDWRITSFSQGERIRIGVAGVLLLFLVGLVIFGDGAGIFRTDERLGYVTNAFTELLSIGITVFILDIVNKHRSEQERTAELILQMGSPNNEFAIEAVRLLKNRGQLVDGTLRHVYLTEASLQGARLSDAELAGCQLVAARLDNAHLAHTNLENASMVMVDLENSSLTGANLRNTRLMGANLSRAKLYGADLTDSSLRNAILDDAEFDEKTTMPDGTKWNNRMDIEKFTNPNSHEFWKPIWVRSGDKTSQEAMDRIYRSRWNI